MVSVCVDSSELAGRDNWLRADQLRLCLWLYQPGLCPLCFPFFHPELYVAGADRQGRERRQQIDSAGWYLALYWLDDESGVAGAGWFVCAGDLQPGDWGRVVPLSWHSGNPWVYPGPRAGDGDGIHLGI